MVSKTRSRKTLLVKKQYLGFPVKDPESRQRFAQLLKSIHRSPGFRVYSKSYHHREELVKLYTEDGGCDYDDFEHYEQCMFRLYRSKVSRALLSSLKKKNPLRAFARNIHAEKFVEAFRDPENSNQFFDCLERQIWVWGSVIHDNLLYSESQARFKVQNLDKPTPEPKKFGNVRIHAWHNGSTRIFMSGADRGGRVKHIPNTIPQYIYNIVKRPGNDDPSHFEHQYIDNILSY